MEGCSHNREAASLGTSTQKPQSAQATRREKDWDVTEIQALLHTAHRAVHQLTFMTAMIQKAYDTLAFSSTSSECGECSARITGDLSLDLKWWSISVAFAVLLLPRQCSDMKGSAIRGLTRAPSPMKKCSAWKQWRHWWETLFELSTYNTTDYNINKSYILLCPYPNHA